METKAKQLNTLAKKYELISLIKVITGEKRDKKFNGVIFQEKHMAWLICAGINRESKR